MKATREVCLFILCLFGFSALMAVETPKSVSRFYDGLKVLEKTSDFDLANETTLEMISCFAASEQSGIEVKLDGMETMNSNKYTQKLHILIYQQKVLKTKCQIVRTEIAEQPDLTSGQQKKNAKHYISYITKQYTQDGKTTKFNDVVETLISDGTIVDMKNTDEVESPSPSLVVSENLNVEQIRARAAYYYTKKKYVEAYNYYENLTQRAPTDGDAFYRLALLTLWRKGCKERFSSKEAESRGMSYLEKAILYGNDEIKQKAENVKTNRLHKNVYF